MPKIKYPPEAILNPSALEKKDFEHIILWMLFNNEECEWSGFTQEPLALRLSTLSKYLSLLKGRNYVENISRGHYRITSEGRKRYLELSTSRGKGRKLSYPPAVIRRRRNYDHWILWMVYNNNHCKWADFLAEPLSINQSSLSKNINILKEKNLIIKDNKVYRITRSGKVEYSRILKGYNLDRQSILDEESKRIEEVTKKTIKFFEKYNIKNEDTQFRFLANVLKLDYSRVESMLKNEEDFDKILLFISTNHPDQYPSYISQEKFSNKYQIKESKLEYYIDEIVENNIFPIKFFKFSMPPDMDFYFQENERLEIILRAITEDHITRLTYLNKLFSRTLDISSTLDLILDDICKTLFEEDLRDSLRDFLPNYINYLAYKIETKRDLIESYNKLEGIIWQNIPTIFQSKSDDTLENQFDEQIQKIDKEIDVSPNNLDLYNSKLKILIYFNQYDEALKLLDVMLEIFSESEKDIQMKKASVLKTMKKVEAGLDIINELQEKYPDDDDLVNYKAYWLQYLDRKEEAQELIQSLVDRIPNNGMYHDTYGEILMNYEEYEEAIKEFQDAIELASDEWYIHQTYIKLGICYKELKNYDFAEENLEKGIELTNKSSIDPETKEKWIAIANLFLLQIE
ncbi:hypothetical protein LCGC14_0779560 [marine sediment metagenome]|uniref:Tetratricopeptide repeat protein n=1 Tax=marine sediment metagenome TaxID=412755 RepID=A0A0F9Q047_9ZZZZ|nr:MAG: Tetratricopeptide repeat protein [Candidatus Lokiarchaeum sp. GC14_75]